MTRTSSRTLAVTAGVVLLVLPACSHSGSRGAPAPTSQSAAAHASSAAPSWTPLDERGDGVRLDAGSYGLVAAGPPVTKVAVIRAPAGYQNYAGWTFVTGEPPFRGLGYMSADRVFRDPCSPGAPAKGDGLRDPGPSVEELAHALTSQKGAITSKPVSVTLDGYDGLYLDYRVDPGLDLASCEGHAFDVLTMSPGEPSGWWLEAAGERAAIWILSVDGQRVLLSWVAVPGSTREQRRELDAMARSTTFESPTL